RSIVDLRARAQQAHADLVAVSEALGDARRNAFVAVAVVVGIRVGGKARIDGREAARIEPQDGHIEARVAELAAVAREQLGRVVTPGSQLAVGSRGSGSAAGED